MKKAGQLLGIFFLIVGISLSTLGYSMYADADFSFIFLLFMSCIATLGLALLFFPGAEIHSNQIKSKEKEWKDVLVNAPAFHKAIWFLSASGGFLVYLFRDNVIQLF